MSNGAKKELLSEEREILLPTLKDRFESNMNRHEGMLWVKVHERLKVKAEKLVAIFKMEMTRGEPDVVGYEKVKDEYIFIDCCLESPIGRRNLCYDREGQAEREKKGIQPKGNVVDMAKEMDIEILNEEQYRELQKLGNFDTKTSSWIKTPLSIRKLGGALFADRRYDQVFVYHNSAPSFYAARGFRGMLRV